MIGQRIGHYDVTGRLGEGGMGEVYRARDTKLNRDVALKVLPEAFTLDADRLARFKREAQVLASLNHPNIGAIYGFEESNPSTSSGQAVQALVLELVEGPTLADRLTGGALPVQEALAIARQIADALDAAHESGILHRDLKPANIKIRPDGAVKVLDFGLAKVLDPTGASNAHALDSPTLTARATQLGTILGTAAYMAPEQARGRAVDRRADIWSFGVVLYEMLTGRRAFDGDDISITLASVLKDNIDWRLLPENTPTAVRRLLRRCLEKDPRRRLNSAADARLELEDAASKPDEQAQVDPAVAHKLRAMARVPWMVAAGASLLAMTSLALWAIRPRSSLPRALTRFAITLPAADRFTGADRPVVAFSPDGQRLVYVANNRLYLRLLDEIDAAPMRGTEGTSEASSPVEPFFSPDGQWVAFWQEGQLKKVSIAGGAPIVLCAARRPSGAGWATDDTIVFGTGPAGILRVPSAGGTPQVVVQVPPGHGATNVQIIPGSRNVLYTLRRLTDATSDQIVAQSVDGGAPRVVVQHGFAGQYVPTGHLVYVDGGALLAVPFNRDTLTVSGAPVSLVAGVQQGSRSPVAQFSVSQTGSLVFVPAVEAAFRRRLVWVDRQGQEELLPAEPRPYSRPRISPDGTRVAVVLQQEPDQAVWIWDFAQRRLTRLTFALRSSLPTWSPDGQYIVFSSNEGIQRQAAAGAGTSERLIATPLLTFPDAFTPDGKSLLVDYRDQNEQWDVNIVSLEGNHLSTPLLAKPFSERFAEVSPDGRWIAYQSDESGRNEIYVRPFPNVDEGRWPISTAGGLTPVWGRNGRELFYLTPGGGMTSVAVQGQPTFSAAIPATLFERSDEPPSASEARQFDVAPDGRHFLMIRSNEQANEPSRLIVVENWFEELKRRVPTQ